MLEQHDAATHTFPIFQRISAALNSLHFLALISLFCCVIIQSFYAFQFLNQANLTITSNNIEIKTSFALEFLVQLCYEQERLAGNISFIAFDDGDLRTTAKIIGYFVENTRASFIADCINKINSDDLQTLPCEAGVKLSKLGSGIKSIAIESYAINEAGKALFHVLPHESVYIPRQGVRDVVMMRCNYLVSNCYC